MLHKSERLSTARKKKYGWFEAIFEKYNHEPQLLTYMKPAGIKQGFLINFNIPRLKDGLKSVVF